MAIILLDTQTINRIAAGDVIASPASVVKEIVENAIDAGSSEIEIKIDSRGRNLITVTDDGNGIEKDDLELACSTNSFTTLSGLSITSPAAIRFIVFVSKRIIAITLPPIYET